MAPVPDGAQLSEDQNYWWDGSQWQPVDGDASGGNGAEPHATGVDARFAENGDRFALMGEAIKRVAGDRLDAISRHLLQNAMKFATHEYGLIQTCLLYTSDAADD